MPLRDPKCGQRRRSHRWPTPRTRVRDDVLSFPASSALLNLSLHQTMSTNGSSFVRPRALCPLANTQVNVMAGLAQKRARESSRRSMDFVHDDESENKCKTTTRPRRRRLLSTRSCVVNEKHRLRTQESLVQAIENRIITSIRRHRIRHL